MLYPLYVHHGEEWLAPTVLGRLLCANQCRVSAQERWDDVVAVPALVFGRGEVGPGVNH